MHRIRASDDRPCRYAAGRRRSRSLYGCEARGVRSSCVSPTSGPNATVEFKPDAGSLKTTIRFDAEECLRLLAAVAEREASSIRLDGARGGLLAALCDKFRRHAGFL